MFVNPFSLPTNNLKCFLSYINFLYVLEFIYITFDSSLPFCLILLYITELYIFLVKVKVLVTQSWPTLCDPRTAACQAPQSVGFSPGKNGLLLPSPRDLSTSGIEPSSPALQADSFLSEPPGKPTYFPMLATNHKFHRSHTPLFTVTTVVTPSEF